MRLGAQAVNVPASASKRKPYAQRAKNNRKLKSENGYSVKGISSAGMKARQKRRESVAASRRAKASQLAENKQKALPAVYLLISYEIS